MNPHLVNRVVLERWRGLVGWAIGLIGITTLQISIYPTIRDSRQDWTQVLDTFPEAFQEIFRLTDYTSEAGYLSAELFSLMLPLIFVGVGATWGARATAEEEELGTADILMALPITRAEILWSRVAASVSVLAALGVVLSLNLAIGMAATSMTIGWSNLFAGIGLMLGLGALFGSLAMAIAALSGRRSVALGVSLGTALAMFLLYSVAPLVSIFDFQLPVNPFQWTIGAQPLINGLDVGYFVRLVGTTAAMTAVSFWAFNRRDIRA